MMIEEQFWETLDRAALPARVGTLAKEGWRLVQICGSCHEAFEILYSFDKDDRFLSLRVAFSKDDPVLPSITESYFGAFSYENEMQDLFGLKLTGLKLNFNGNFYRLAKKNPFLDTPPAVAPAPGGVSS
ncbi:MAG: NADH-quinone oxidoreductase subunit C [Verrucomicrobiae bacterium]|nr:NADH-quinone oxidoreductase subunit C [Verrucomicrobiae bacterium]